MQNSLDPNRKYEEPDLNKKEKEVKKEEKKASPAAAKMRNDLLALCAVLLIAGVAFAIKRNSEQINEDVPAEVDPRIMEGDMVRTIEGRRAALYSGIGDDTERIDVINKDELSQVLCVYDDGYALIEHGDNIGFVKLGLFESAEDEKYLQALELKDSKNIETEDTLVYIVRGGEKEGQSPDFAHQEMDDSEEFTSYEPDSEESENESPEESQNYSVSEDGTVLTITGIGRMRDCILPEDVDEQSWWSNKDQRKKSINPWMEKGITRIEIGEGVTSIGDNAFCACESLTEVVLPESLEEIGENAFRECSALKTINFPKNLHIIGNSAFCQCKALETVTLPENLQIIGNDAFWSSGLTSVFISDQVVLIGDDAFGNNKLSSFSVGKDNERYAEIDGVLYDKIKKELVAYPKMQTGTSFSVPEGIKGIGRCAFWFSGIKNVSLPQSIRYVREYAFGGCELESLPLRDGLAALGYGAFRYATCESPGTSLPDTMKSVGPNAFDDFPLGRIYIPAGTAFIGNSAFDPDKTDFFAVSENNPFYRSENGVLFRKKDDALLYYNGKGGRKEYVIPDGTKVLTDGAFLGCHALRKVYIPASVTLIGRNTFGWDSYDDLKIEPLLCIEKESYAREYVEEMNYDNWEYAGKDDCLTGNE